MNKKQGREMETNQRKTGIYGSEAVQMYSEAEYSENPNYSEENWVGAWLSLIHI